MTLNRPLAQSLRAMRGVQRYAAQKRKMPADGAFPPHAAAEDFGISRKGQLRNIRRPARRFNNGIA